MYPATMHVPAHCQNGAQRRGSAAAGQAAAANVSGSRAGRLRCWCACLQPITLFAKERCKFTAPAFQDAAVLSVAAAMQAGTSVGRNPSFEWCVLALKNCKQRSAWKGAKGAEHCAARVLEAADALDCRQVWNALLLATALQR